MEKPLLHHRKTASTVASTATSKLASMEAKMENQIKYETSLYFIKKMRHAGLISDQDFEKAERFLYEKYKPLIRH